MANGQRFVSPTPDPLSLLVGLHSLGGKTLKTAETDKDAAAPPIVFQAPLFTNRLPRNRRPALSPFSTTSQARA